MTTNMNERDVLKKHYAKIGRKGGKGGKGSERRLWAGRLAAATRWNNTALIEKAKTKLAKLAQ